MRKQVTISYSSAAIAAKQGDAIRAAARAANSAATQERVGIMLSVGAVALATFAAVLILCAVFA